MDTLPEALVEVLGCDHVSLGAAAVNYAYRPWTRLGAPRAVLRPNSTEQVAAVMRLAYAARAPVVAWGGRTGLVDGARADGAIALSFERLRKVCQRGVTTRSTLR